MALNFAEFKAARRDAEKRIAERQHVRGVQVCEACEIPLQESVTGSRPVGDGKHVCSDCFFEQLGAELDQHPILMPRALRQA